MSELARYLIKKFLFILKGRLPAIKKVYGHSFPAIHLKKMDSFDYIFNFSSELLIAGLAAIVVILNIAYFGPLGFHKERLSDQSLAAKFLSLHAGLNNKLATHNSTVKTTVIASANLVPLAFADEAISGSGDSSDTGADDSEFDEGVMTKPLDDAKDLLQNAIKVYKTEPGDTLSSIGKEFGLSTRTIQWSNNLPLNQPIKTGWFLIISPEEGVVIHKTGPSDSIPSLAKKYGVTEEAIINKNALEDVGDIEPDMYLYIPGGIVKEAPKPVPKPGKPSSGGSVVSNVGNPFPKGQCTWYVATQVHVYWRGNAKDWPKNAAAAGATISHTPGVGRIAVTRASRYGHVEMVRAVYDNGTMLVEDYNYSGRRQHGTHIENISAAVAFIIP